MNPSKYDQSEIKAIYEALTTPTSKGAGFLRVVQATTRPDKFKIKYKLYNIHAHQQQLGYINIQATDTVYPYFSPGVLIPPRTTCTFAEALQYIQAGMKNYLLLETLPESLRTDGKSYWHWNLEFSKSRPQEF